jgi:1-acyl-sn-glycerol-3-phosphate acyltransferase
MASHLWAAIGIGTVTVVLEFHPPVTFAQFGSRKALAAHCQATIARGLETANTGRPALVTAAPAPVGGDFPVAASP